ncbi:MAG: hypothetical protein JXQ87_17275 [Bacteroidia bacterium]
MEYTYNKNKASNQFYTVHSLVGIFQKLYRDLFLFQNSIFTGVLRCLFFLSVFLFFTQYSSAQNGSFDSLIEQLFDTNEDIDIDHINYSKDSAEEVSIANVLRNDYTYHDLYIIYTYGGSKIEESNINFRRFIKWFNALSPKITSYDLDYTKIMFHVVGHFRNVGKLSIADSLNEVFISYNNSLGTLTPISANVTLTFRTV